MKHCTQCGTQIPENIRFCPKCGSKVSQLQQQTENPDLINHALEQSNLEKNYDTEIVNMPNTNKINNVSFIGKIYNSLFGFTNIGNKFRMVATILAAFLTAAFVIFDFMYLIFLTMNMGIGGLMIAICLIIPASLLLLVVLHMPLWKLYTWGEIYDSVHRDK